MTSLVREMAPLLDTEHGPPLSMVTVAADRFIMDPGVRALLHDLRIPVGRVLSWAELPAGPLHEGPPYTSEWYSWEIVPLSRRTHMAAQFACIPEHAGDLAIWIFVSQAVFALDTILHGLGEGSLAK
jgi:hypothetical protein